MKKLVPCICAALTLSTHAHPSDLKFTRFSGGDVNPVPGLHGGCCHG